MTDVTVTEQGRAPARQISRKVATAIEAMVWQGLPRREAAQVAGLEEHSLYKAMRLPPVKAEYLAQCEVLRTSGRARRIHRLEAMVEQDDNKAAVVNAALALDRTDESSIQSTRSSQATPGVCINIITGSQSTPERVIEAKPLISLDAGAAALPNQGSAEP